MKLSARLVVLGVTGPIVGLVIFLAIASAASISLAQKAKVQINALFNADNRTKLLLATMSIQNDADGATKQLLKDSLQISKSLDPLDISPQGVVSWKGQPIKANQAPTLLNNLLRIPQSMPTESASVYFKGGDGVWKRLTGIDSDGTHLKPGWVPPKANIDEMRALYSLGDGRIQPRDTMLLRDGHWRMYRLTPLQPAGPKQMMVLGVSVRNDAANRMLTSSASLFPYKHHQEAFFGLTPSGQLYCSFAQPSAKACNELQQIMQRTGGIPNPTHGKTASLMERRYQALDPKTNKPIQKYLFIATFPYWHWIAVIETQESLLGHTLNPLKETTRDVVLILLGSSLLLIAGAAAGALKMSQGIQRDLAALASAADAIAHGESMQSLSYPENDSIGTLVEAFNRMSGAVKNREDSLKAKIQTLEININEQALHGQICSITDDPNFSKLNLRAKAMRQRRESRAKQSPEQE